MEAGLSVARVEFEPGKFSLIVGKPAEGAAGQAANEWDAP